MCIFDNLRLRNPKFARLKLHGFCQSFIRKGLSTNEVVQICSQAIHIFTQLA